MKLDACIDKITKYLDSENTQPLIVDVQNTNDLNSILIHFQVDGNKIISASSFCNKDEFPRIETLLQNISYYKENVFITGLTSFLKFFGEEEVHNQLADILNMTTEGHIVILSFQCNKQLDFLDLRLNRRICCIEGKTNIKPKLIFISKEFSLSIPQNAVIVNGIDEIAYAIENKNENSIYVKTSKKKDIYPRSIYKIIDMNNAYNILIERDSSLSVLDQTLGTNEQWEYVLSLFSDKKYFQDVINLVFGNYRNLGILASNYNNFNDNKKWLYFIALKLYGSKSNWCLNIASTKANKYTELIREVFRSILDINHLDKDFILHYQERKALLVALGNPIDNVIDYCKMVKQKGKYAIYYLTDNTRQEKEMIFAQLDKYGEQFSRNEIESILKLVYPNLAAYLQPYRFKIPLLEKYFSMYNYEKVINKILPEFEKIVIEQAIKREFNFLLEPRTAKIDSIDKSNSQLYFIDALGVEYLSFILEKCKEKKLMANITLCRSFLPSITSKNKEFIEEFEKIGLKVIPVKEIDEIKHHGIDEYDYQHTKLPIHLIGELEIIEEILDNIKLKLAQEMCEKVFIISDHGSSRLAVIHETENMWEMASKGKYSGRCCFKSEIDVKSKYAIETDDFWVLANYDRFKGGRKANVEVHGGATLEEVTVPIIEISKVPDDIEISILDKVITVSFRKKAAIRLFSKTKLKNVSICVDNIYFDAYEIDDNIYMVEMPQLKKAKDYYIEVYSSNNLVASGLSFTIKKESAQEKDLL